MATEILYKITLNGEFLDANGNSIPNGDKGAITFDSITDVYAFVEASGSLGEYYIYTTAIKTE
jgi:hypothetical protein